MPNYIGGVFKEALIKSNSFKLAKTTVKLIDLIRIFFKQKKSNSIWVASKYHQRRMEDYPVVELNMLI